MKNSKPETIVTNGIDLQALGVRLYTDGQALGAALETSYSSCAVGLTSGVVAQLTALHAIRESVALAPSIRQFFDAIESAAPTYTKEVKRYKQTKSDALAICKAWDRGARFGVAGLNKMATAARAFLNKGAEADKGEAKGADATPTANTAATADKYLRSQAAAMRAYCEKNKKLIAAAWLHAVGEFAEAAAAIPSQDE